MKILIMGLSGSGKTFLSKLLQKELSCAWYNADNLREMANDWDFSEAGRKMHVENLMQIIRFGWIQSKRATTRIQIRFLRNRKILI